VPAVLDSKEKDVGNVTYITTKLITDSASIRKKKWDFKEVLISREMDLNLRIRRVC
jgi:hypothetical protein